MYVFQHLEIALNFDNTNPIVTGHHIVSSRHQVTISGGEHFKHSQHEKVVPLLIEIVSASHSPYNGGDEFPRIVL